MGYEIINVVDLDLEEIVAIHSSSVNVPSFANTRMALHTPTSPALGEKRNMPRDSVLRTARDGLAGSFDKAAPQAKRARIQNGFSIDELLARPEPGGSSLNDIGIESALDGEWKTPEILEPYFRSLTGDWVPSMDLNRSQKKNFKNIFKKTERSIINKRGIRRFQNLNKKEKFSVDNNINLTKVSLDRRAKIILSERRGIISREYKDFLIGINQDTINYCLHGNVLLSSALTDWFDRQ